VAFNDEPHSAPRIRSGLARGSKWKPGPAPILNRSRLVPRRRLGRKHDIDAIIGLRRIRIPEVDRILDADRCDTRRRARLTFVADACDVARLPRFRVGQRLLAGFDHRVVGSDVGVVFPISNADGYRPRSTVALTDFQRAGEREGIAGSNAFPQHYGAKQLAGGLPLFDPVFSKVDELTLFHLRLIWRAEWATCFPLESSDDEFILGEVILDESRVALFHREFGPNGTHLAIGLAYDEVIWRGYVPTLLMAVRALIAALVRVHSVDRPRQMPST